MANADRHPSTRGQKGGAQQPRPDPGSCGRAGRVSNGDREFRAPGGLADTPEFNVLVFGFLLSLPWELLQVPFYAGMVTAPHWQSVKYCTDAAAGDAVILLAAYWIVASISRSRQWIRNPKWRQVFGFLGIGMTATVTIEYFATRSAWGWRYSPLMPVDPLLGTGLVTILMWLIVPLLVLWFGRRQLR